MSDIKLIPYHVYHFKDMWREFDFVCLKYVKRENKCRVMMLNYSTTKANMNEYVYPCGVINYWRMRVGDVRFIEKSDYTENAIRLAKLITL